MIQKRIFPQSWLGIAITIPRGHKIIEELGPYSLILIKMNLGLDL